MKKSQLNSKVLLSFVLSIGLCCLLFFSITHHISNAADRTGPRVAQSQTIKTTDQGVLSNEGLTRNNKTSQIRSDEAAQKLLKEAEFYRWEIKDYKKAEETYWQVTTEYVNTKQAIDAYLGLGGLYRWEMKPAELDKAADVYQRLLSEYPMYEKIQDVYLQLGGIYQYDMKPSQDTKAAAIYTELVIKYPNTNEANQGRMRLAAVYSRLGEIEKKSDYYQQTLRYYYAVLDVVPEKDPLVPEVKVQIANTFLFDIRYFETALPLYENIMREYPGTKYAYESLLWSAYIKYKEKKELSADEAVRICEQIISKPDILQKNRNTGSNPQKDSYWLNVKASARYTIGYIRYWQGQRHLALAEFQKVLDEYGDIAYEDLKAECYLFIGHIREQQEQYTLALQTYETAMKATPNSKFCFAGGEIPLRIDRARTQIELQKEPRYFRR